MKFALIHNQGFLPYIKKALEKDGHEVIINQFSKDVDICINENIMLMYYVYRNLREFKKNHIKLVNFINDIPIWRLEKKFYKNTFKKKFFQILYNSTHKNPVLYEKINNFNPDPKRNRISNFLAFKAQKYFNKLYVNQVYYQINYRKFLKASDLNLSISKYTQKVVSRFLKIETQVCYQCVNSDYLLGLPKSKIKYDAINISRIVPHKRQELFVKAANKLGLKILVLGRYADKNIKLDCPHFFYQDHKKVLDILNQTKFYVAPSIFEGFGMTPVEAAFLDKPVIASDIFVHRDVLGDYPIYFKRDNMNDLIEKMKIIMNKPYLKNNVEMKKRYSIQALKKRLLEHIESIT